MMSGFRPTKLRSRTPESPLFAHFAVQSIRQPWLCQFILFLLLASVSSPVLLCADKKPKPLVPAQDTNQPKIRVQVDLVNLHVAVFDAQGRSVAGLKKSDFKVYEDNIEQAIANFGMETETPMTVGILVDTSGSMKSEKLSKAVEAVKVLAKTLSPKDEIFILSFTDEPYLLLDFTSADTDLTRPLSRLVAKGPTSIGAAVEEGIFKMRDASNQKQALVAISDGLDVPGGGVIDKIRSHETLVYGIGLKGLGGLSGLAAHIQAFNVRGSSLNVYANESGGKAIFVKTPEELLQACRDIVFDLKGQYQISYYPTNTARDGKYRRIKVAVDRPNDSVRYRRGYYAPRR